MKTYGFFNCIDGNIYAEAINGILIGDTEEIRIQKAIKEMYKLNKNLKKEYQFINLITIKEIGSHGINFHQYKLWETKIINELKGV